MKPTLLITAAVLLSATTFAQTTVKNQESAKSVTSIQSEKGGGKVKSSGNASSSASSQPGSAISKEVTVSANEQSDLKVAEVKKNNKIDENASLINGADIASSAGIKNNGNLLKKEGKSKVSTSTALAVKNSNQVRTGMNKTIIKPIHKMQAISATTVISGSAKANSFKPHPASMKMNTHMKTNTRIRVK